MRRHVRPHARTLLLVSALLALASPSSAPAQEMSTGIDLDGSVGASPFLAEPGSGYRHGAQHFGIQVDTAFGTRALGSTLQHDYGVLTFQYGRVFSGLMAPNGWNTGNWELLLEAFVGEQTRPHHAAFAGITPVFRYNFVTGSNWVPHVEGGVGGTYSEIRDGDLSADFEFNLHWGVGVRWYATPTTSVNFGYRWRHLSNLGLSQPNKGVDAHAFHLGFSRAF